LVRYRLWSNLKAQFFQRSFRRLLILLGISSRYANRADELSALHHRTASAFRHQPRPVRKLRHIRVLEAKGQSSNIMRSDRTLDTDNFRKRVLHKLAHDLDCRD
jgi:hypothetical protein